MTSEIFFVHFSSAAGSRPSDEQADFGFRTGMAEEDTPALGLEFPFGFGNEVAHFLQLLEGPLSRGPRCLVTSCGNRVQH